jgi:hypothetical protein
MVAVLREPPRIHRLAAPVPAWDTITPSLVGFTAGGLFPILDHLQAALAHLDRELGLVSCRIVCDNSNVDNPPMEK